jgi:hypothetical protein
VKTGLEFKAETKLDLAGDFRALDFNSVVYVTLCYSYTKTLEVQPLEILRVVRNYVCG